MATTSLKGLSSMATSNLISALCEGPCRRHGLDVEFRSGGGVTMEEELLNGAFADVVVLAESATDRLEAAGILVPGTSRRLFVSDVVAAVPDTDGCVALTTEDDLRSALLGANRVAYSTGPSGNGLLGLLRRWGIEEDLRANLLQAPPGISVGSLLAEGRADLGFQQRSELTGVQGVRVLGPLPATAAIRSVFSGGVTQASRDQARALEILGVFTGAEAAELIPAYGLGPA